MLWLSQGTGDVTAFFITFQTTIEKITLFKTGTLELVILVEHYFIEMFHRLNTKTTWIILLLRNSG